MNIEKFSKFEALINIDDAIRESCQNLAEAIKNEALVDFKPHRDYANSWTWGIREKGGEKYGVVYNADHYRLAHLLEHGHVIKNKYGTYGRTSGKEHIKPCFDKEKEVYIKNVNASKLEAKLK